MQPSRRIRLVAGAVAFAAALFPAASRAQLLETFASPVDGVDVFGTGYGSAVAVGSGYLAIGAPALDTLGFTNNGRVQAFQIDGTPTVTMTLPQHNAEVGAALAISQGVLFVGAPGADGEQGVVHRRELFSGINATFSAIAPEAGGRFGQSIDADDTRVLVGMPGFDSMSTDSGVAYTYDLDFNIDRTYFDPTYAGSERFGTSVALASGIVALGGGPLARSGTGGLAIHDRATGTLGLIEDGDTAGSLFGASSDGNFLGFVAGAPGASSSDGVVGRWHPLTGAPQALFLPPTSGAAGEFGFSVAIGDVYLVVGAPADPEPGFGDAGAVYVYDVSDNSFVTRIANPSPDDGDRFGAAVSTQEGLILVGAPGDDTTAPDAGAAYLFDPAVPVELSGYEIE